MAWLDQAEVKLRACNWPNSSWVAVRVAHLTGDALTWYTANLPQEGDGSTDWTAFEDELAGAYLGLSLQTQARRKLATLTQKGGQLTAYISEFQQNLTHLTGYMRQVPLKPADVRCQLTDFLSECGDFATLTLAACIPAHLLGKHHLVGRCRHSRGSKRLLLHTRLGIPEVLVLLPLLGFEQVRLVKGKRSLHGVQLRLEQGFARCTPLLLLPQNGLVPGQPKLQHFGRLRGSKWDSGLQTLSLVPRNIFRVHMHTWALWWSEAGRWP